MANLRQSSHLPEFNFIFTLLQSVIVLSDLSISGAAAAARRCLSQESAAFFPDPLLRSLTRVFDLETVTSGRSRGVSELSG